MMKPPQILLEIMSFMVGTPVVLESQIHERCGFVIQPEMARRTHRRSLFVSPVARPEFHHNQKYKSKHI